MIKNSSKPMVWSFLFYLWCGRGVKIVNKIKPIKKLDTYF
uniref:Uncharacterized protein n=1 Tax=Myoviridae sp. ctai52 TaxID=2825134 RepID=A0A8S5VFC4_9CAUD|nr:MAG TPA: hypothetical protein [Myoviridae sp. ctai52]